MNMRYFLCRNSKKVRPNEEVLTMRKCLRSGCKKYDDDRCCLECTENCLGKCKWDSDMLDLKECSLVIKE